MPQKIVFAGGGTGGHAYPLIAIIRALKAQDKELEIYYVHPSQKDFTEDFLKEGVKCRRIISGKLRRYFSLRTIFLPLKIFIGFFQALVFIRNIAPGLIFLKGGYGSLPIGLAGLVFRVPILVHESDVMPGLVTRIFAKKACKILTSFPETRQYLPKGLPILNVGNPVRPFISQKEKPEKARKLLGITKTNKPVILALGGSQGSTEINELIFNLLDELTAKFLVIHILGENNFQAYQEELLKMRKEKKTKDYFIYPFLGEEKLRAAYALSDLVVARAGAGIIFELALLSKPSILIPLLGAASDHQRKNAYSYMEKGACLVIEKPNLKKNIFLQSLLKLFQDRQKLADMSRAAKNFSKPLAAQKIAEIILEKALL